MAIKTFTLPAGTVCHRNGIPFELVTATQIQCEEANWPLVRDQFKPVSLPGAADYAAQATAASINRAWQV